MCDKQARLLRVPRSSVTNRIVVVLIIKMAMLSRIFNCSNGEWMLITTWTAKKSNDDSQS